MTLTQITTTAKENLAKTKATYSVISSYRFIETYNTASDSSKEEVLEYIRTNNSRAIFKWMYKESGYVPVFKLRALCRTYGIRNYNRLAPRALMSQLTKLLSEEQIYSAIYK